MQKSTHINVGLFTTLLLLINTLTFNIFYLFYMMFALLPDLDHPQGSLTKKLGIRLPFKHRGFSHTLLFLLLVQGAINLWFHYLGLSLSKMDQVVIFFLLNSHLLADIFTVSGFPYLWPLYKKPITIPGISIFTTGTNGEYFFNLVATLGNIGLIYIILSTNVIQKLLPTITTTQEWVKSSPQVLGVTLVLFLIFGIHIISSEIKKLKGDLTGLGSLFIKLMTKLILSTIVLGGIGYAIHMWIFPTLDTSVIISSWLGLVVLSTFLMLSKHLEFISKSTGYMVSIFVVFVFFLLTFNFGGIADLFLK